MLPGKNAPTHIAASGCQLPKAWSRSSVFSLLCSSPAHSHRHFQLGELRPAALTRANNPGDTQGNPPQALPCHRPATWFVGAKNRGGGSVSVLGATRPPVAGASTSGALPLPSWEQPQPSREQPQRSEEQPEQLQPSREQPQPSREAAAFKGAAGAAVAFKGAAGAAAAFTGAVGAAGAAGAFRGAVFSFTTSGHRLSIHPAVIDPERELTPCTARGKLQTRKGASWSGPWVPK
jgi:hypothetical protein